MKDGNGLAIKIISVIVGLVILATGLFSLFTGTFGWGATDVTAPTMITKQESFISWLLLTIETIVFGAAALYLTFFPNPTQTMRFNVLIFAFLGLSAILIGVDGFIRKTTPLWYIPLFVIFIGAVLIILAYLQFTGKKLLKKPLF